MLQLQFKTESVTLQSSASNIHRRQFLPKSHLRSPTLQKHTN